MKKVIIILCFMILSGIIALTLLLGKNNVPCTPLNILRASGVMIAWAGAGYFYCHIEFLYDKKKEEL